MGVMDTPPQTPAVPIATPPVAPAATPPAGGSVILTPEVLGQIIAEWEAGKDAAKKGKKRGSYKRKLPKFLTLDQVRRLFAVLPREPELVMAYRLMYEALMRVSEVCRLRVRDIIFDEGAVMIIGSKSGDRTIGIDDKLLSDLKIHVEERGPEEFICQSDFMRPFTRHILEKRLKRRLHIAGLEKQKDGKGEVNFIIHPHTLRHTGAREMLNQGRLSLNEVQEMLGHRNVATTSIYTSTTGRALRDKLKAKGGISVAEEDKVT